MAGVDELVRVARDGAGELVLGPAGRGRGAWLCRGSSACLDLAERRGAFSRALRAPVSAVSIAQLRSELSATVAPSGAFGPAGENRARMEGRRSQSRKD
ncbi:MAG: YlxR family protein [Actinomycetota bacterium]|nr:YlxR family protein [Actinomycetota bacterium]